MTQTALVVGASRGLGLGLVREFLRRGWEVIGTARAPSALDRLKEEAGGRLTVLPLDVLQDESIAALADSLNGRALDLLFVNAGVTNRTSETMGEVSAEEFCRVMLTNTRAPLRLIEALLPTVAPGGVVAVMSSGLGSVGANTSGGWEVYRASKAALNTAMRSLAARHRTHTLLTLVPGWVRTDMGGSGASLDVDTSVKGLADVIAGHRGKGGNAFLDYKGATVPW
jgi:NAD(P)-dependent dehydrogenase (short-subunit alcohol dehydrogenase family)